MFLFLLHFRVSFAGLCIGHLAHETNYRLFFFVSLLSELGNFFEDIAFDLDANFFYRAS